MPYIVKFIGIVMLGAGIALFLQPSLLNRLFDYVKVGKRVYIAGIGRIIVSSLLLISIQEVALPWIVGIIGGLILISGVLCFVLKLPTIHKFIDWIYNKSDNVHRAAACVSGTFGVLLIYAA